jgi:transcriptional regulator with XRE-family HTH domain
MSKDLVKQIGRRLAELRKLSKLSQAELAKKSNISAEFISRVERGLNAPSIKTLSWMLNAMDFTISDFFKYFEMDNWDFEVESLTVAYKSQEGKIIRKKYKLAEKED